MPTPESHEVTRLLLAWSEGDQESLDRLMPLVLTEAEMAEALKVSPETVRRDWRLAKSWLLLKMSGGNLDEA